MIKSLITLFIGSLLISQFANAEIIDVPVIVGVYPDDEQIIKNLNVRDEAWRKSFVKITYRKEIMDDLVVYHYLVRNIGKASIGAIQIGNDEISPFANGFQIPSTNIVKLESSIPEFTVKLEQQEENPYECIGVEGVYDFDYLEPGNSMEVSVYLSKDDPIFENLHWVVIFGGSPERLNGKIELEKD